jgi:hypothetical protein
MCLIRLRVDYGEPTITVMHMFDRPCWSIFCIAGISREALTERLPVPVRYPRSGEG